MKYKKRDIGKDIINIIIGLVAVTFVYYIYNWIKEPFPSAFFVILFMLVLIYLEMPKK